MEAYNYLSKWEGDYTSARVARDFEGVAFTNATLEPHDWHKKMTCRKCKKIGHIATFCENEKVSSTNVQDGEAHDANE
jgi:hypothetical protein